ncbi:MAG TPA: sialidase family protein, partial [Candidatus Thermoplasmatota archaeon]|nr:sialidase family protein [Candidatus Thermoplasmatota archaeon]
MRPPTTGAAAVVALLLLSGCLAGPATVVAPLGEPAPALACGEPCTFPIDASPGGGWEPHVAVSPLDPDHVVVATRAQGSGRTPLSFVLWFDVHVSRDGGRSWNVTHLRATQPLLDRPDPDAPNVVGDPVLAFLPDGALLLAGATLQVAGGPGVAVLRNVEMFVARSEDGGASFAEPVVVARSEGAYVQAGLPPLVPRADAGVLSERATNISTLRRTATPGPPATWSVAPARRSAP